ncbi:response regulator transcription factor [Halovenus sp. HT40]|uniref:response regulator transcription factor n=1 Tax=Halovenus sp. HT40 TaxID=3126691 RepID=UPI00300F5DD0
MSAEILVVDDDEPIRRLVSHRLESAGYTVRLCEDGQVAADLLEDGYSPQMAILDVMMPRLDGTRLLRMIRNGQLSIDEDLPIILLTSRGREEHVLEGFDSGADDYITKPFRASELLARVQRYADN